MKYRNIDKNTHETKVSFRKITTAIKNNKMLAPYLGSYSKSRIKGWGHTHGYIQVKDYILDIVNEPNEYKDYGVCYRRSHYIHGAKVELTCEYEHAKKGWTNDHEKELKEVLKKFVGVKIIL